MTALRNYPKEFVERTTQLLEKIEPKAKEEGLEITLLLNCLLGMVVTALENVDRCKKGVFNKKLHSEELKPLIPKKIVSIKKSELIDKYADRVSKLELLKSYQKVEFGIPEFRIKTQPKKEIYDKDLRWLLTKIRNGVAHQNIMPINQGDNWEGIRIWNKDNNGLKNFAIEFKISELREFTKYVVNLYLENMN